MIHQNRMKWASSFHKGEKSSIYTLMTLRLLFFLPVSSGKKKVESVVEKEKKNSLSVLPDWLKTGYIYINIVIAGLDQWKYEDKSDTICAAPHLITKTTLL